MRIELLDQPVLLVSSQVPESSTLNSDTLKQIESFLEEEISQVREQMEKPSEEEIVQSAGFGLHLQDDAQVRSIVLESEWEETNSHGAENVEVSELLRVVRVRLEHGDRQRLLGWLADRDEEIPLVCGMGNADYLFVSARDTFRMLNQLKAELEE